MNKSLAAMVVLYSVIAQQTWAQDTYKIQPLLVSSQLSEEFVPSALNDFASIVGSTDASSEVAFILRNNTSTSIPTESNGPATALGVNDNGLVVGFVSSTQNQDQTQAYLYNGVSLTSLAGLPGGSSLASAINNSGIIAGAVTMGGQPHSAIWQNQSLQILDNSADDISEALAINSSGAVVGFLGTGADPGNHLQPALWQNGSLETLGTLGGAAGRATGINDQAQVVGDAFNTDGYWHAFIWQSGQMTDLGTLPGGMGSQADAINDIGDVVGRSYVAGFQFDAVL